MLRLKNQQLSYTPVRTDCSRYSTFCGVEYMMNLVNPAVPSASEIYLRATTSTAKYTILNFRSLKMDQGRGFYKAHTGFNLRADTATPTGAFVETFSTPTTIDNR